ncbi:MAG: MFS transporter [Terriglobia bacterium]|jgi:MFS family permease
MVTTQSATAAPGLGETDSRYYGWRVAFAACLGVMVGFGSLFVYTFGVFVRPLSAQFGWSREGISRGFGLAALSVAFCSPALGHWLDRYGPRRVILPCVAVFGCGIASLALLRSHLWQFYATCILLGTVGNGAAHLSYARAISTWFRRRLGMALAFVMLGAGMGAMILPLVAQTVISRSGWRAAYLLLGGIALVLGLVPTWAFVRERPQKEDDPAPVALTGMTWQQGVRTYPFWIIVVALFVGSITMNGAITHMAALLTDRGVTPGTAALCASMLGGVSVLARLGVGSLLDRYFGGRVAMLVYLFNAAGIFLLARANSFVAGCLAAALIGFGAGGEADITPYLLTRYFGLRAFSTLYGLTWTFYAVAGAIGPILLGRAFDLTGSYAPVLGALAVATALAAVLLILLPQYSNSPVIDQG